MNLVGDLHAYPWTQMTINNCNTYAKAGPPSVLVDPGHSRLYGHVESGLMDDGLITQPDLVILTHCHPDHMEAAELLQKNGSKIAMHPVEAEYMQGDGRRLAAALGMNFPELTVDFFLEEGEFEAGGDTFQVFHTPGHSPGHVCLYHTTTKALFAGDLIFAQGVGRVDFPGGNADELKNSIRKMAGLDLEWILPGHGPFIKGAESIRRNFELIVTMYFGML